MRKIYRYGKLGKGPEGRIITVSSPGRILWSGAIANTVLFGLLFLAIFSLVGFGLSRRLIVAIAVGVWVPIAVGWGCYFINPFVMPSSNYHALHPYGQVKLQEARGMLPWANLPADATEAKSLEVTVERAFGLCEWTVSRSYLDNLDEDVSRVDPHAHHLATGDGLALGWPYAGITTHTEPSWNPALGRPDRFDIITKTPFQVYGPGYIVDVIFYTVIAFIMFRLPGLLRRYYRKKQGLCKACGYPIGVSERCSECGHVIPANERIYSQFTKVE